MDTTRSTISDSLAITDGRIVVKLDVFAVFGSTTESVRETALAVCQRSSSRHVGNGISMLEPTYRLKTLVDYWDAYLGAKVFEQPDM